MTVTALGDRSELRAIDQGPGLSPTDRDRISALFQRQGGQSAHPVPASASRCPAA